jgi:hypothetical protein
MKYSLPGLPVPEQTSRVVQMVISTRDAEVGSVSSSKIIPVYTKAGAERPLSVGPVDRLVLHGIDYRASVENESSLGGCGRGTLPRPSRP